MITKARDPHIPCKRCQQMQRPDDPMCPHCGYPLADTRPESERNVQPLPVPTPASEEKKNPTYVLRERKPADGVPANAPEPLSLPAALKKLEPSRMGPAAMVIGGLAVVAIAISAVFYFR